MPDCVSHFALLRFAMQDLSGEQQSLIGAHVSHCTSCRSVVEQATVDITAYQRDASCHRRRLRERIGQVAVEEKQGNRWFGASGPKLGLTAATAIAAVATFAIVFTPPDSTLDVGQRAAYVGLKGAVALRVMAQRSTEQWVVGNGELALRPGDQIRIAITTPSAGFVSIFSLDGHRQLTYYYPSTDPQHVPDAGWIDTGGLSELEGNWLLDDSPGFETVVAVFSPQPFSRADVHRQLKNSMFGDVAELNSKARRLGLDVAVVRMPKAP